MPPELEAALKQIAEVQQRLTKLADEASSAASEAERVQVEVAGDIAATDEEEKEARTVLERAGFLTAV